jgi:protein-S-isoprenylcysteine O-methyltransferase Ste14
VNADLARAVFAFLALPGVIAFALPLWLARGRPFQPIGLVALVPGLVGLFWCVRDFYVKGKGTLAPWSPPKELVVVGLYRWSRNPMYVSVLLVLVGWALGFGSRTLWIYAAIVAVGFHLRVLLNEEPFLARTHGAAWETYRGRVRRWL